ncbi:MAG: hypothetical protein JWL68_3113 [Actinomycetia bacterium]|nr:hypothetical protein [Actinomycetes bacterium]
MTLVVNHLGQDVAEPVRDGIMVRCAATRGGAAVLGAATPAGEQLAESVMYFDFVSKELPLMLDRWRPAKPRTGTDLAPGPLPVGARDRCR